MCVCVHVRERERDHLTDASASYSDKTVIEKITAALKIFIIAFFFLYFYFYLSYRAFVFQTFKL